MSGEQQSNLITFYDNYQTPLAAGQYRFVLQQTVAVEGERERYYYRDQGFDVLAPRYAVENAELQSYFPPEGGAGDYKNTLPHIVLRTRTLPWERNVWESSGRQPWLALLVISERDRVEGRVDTKPAIVADLGVTETRGDYSVRTENGTSILVPNFTRENDDAKTTMRVLDLNIDLFRGLCPRREDLPLLAHIRRVDTANKTPSEMAADGEFAVLVANRFPAAGANTAYVISLEGWENLIDAPSNQSFPASRLRLVTLASWSFVNDSDGHATFGGMMVQLRKNAGIFGGAGATPSPDSRVAQALARGYVPIDYRPMDSTAAFAWYRGPLSPLPRPQVTQDAFNNADAALIFDEQTGLMDVSYSAAWQLGRLSALSSPAFSKALRLFVERRQNALEFVRQIRAFLDLHAGAFDDLKSGEPQPEQVAITDELLRWLADLVMFYPIPFHYLVPHSSLLPRESLRFFHVDNNWVDALVDGAFSIAVRTLADQAIVSRKDLQATLSRIVYEHRLRLTGKRVDWNVSEEYMKASKTGFLLRSSIVSDWPGVEVTAKTSGALGGKAPEILRLDQISDGVLFCLASGPIEEVIFREPRESVTFGVNTDGSVNPASGAAINVKRELMRAASREGVVDIAGLGLRLNPESGVRPAEFAVQMIRQPEEQVIRWS